MEAILETRALSVGYSGKTIVENVNVCVKPGEICTIIGPNGAGKSTLLKTLGGLLPSISGEIILNGRNIKSIPGGDIARTMSILLTDRINSEYMTCMDVVAYGRYPYTGKMGILRPEDWAAVDRAMEMVNIKELADRPFACLSDGQRQRVMLGRAICQETELIILDEPTSFLDMGYRIELMTLLDNLAHNENIAVLMTMHELDTAKAVSDTIVSIKAGKVDRYGTTEQVLEGDYILSLYDVDREGYNRFFG